MLYLFKNYLRNLEQKRIFQSPVSLLIIVASTIFFSELLVMVYLSDLPSPYIWAEALFDSMLLIGLLFPVLYFFMFRPLKTQIDKLVDTNRHLQIEIMERKKAEEALQESEKRLRHLSSKLLTAQEDERRRISMELHDELGQALSVLKLRLSYIGRKLTEDQGTLREECDNTLQYIDQVIEDVRRLSRDLSPSILVDLGITAALKRLVDGFVKHHNIRVSLDVDNIEPLLPQKNHIILYRIFQEALTNIGKYAQANKVTLIAKQQDGMISFLIEDDGKGFDVREFLLRDGAEKGMGVAAMGERVWMLGGILDLKSQGGKGTQIRFSIPIEGEKS
jgi:signal transduction histidine kinase